MQAINLNQIPTEYIMKTKAGKLWRCGRGYRKNWPKLMGKLVLLHNTPYTLINRIKEAGKWYLIFTDGTNNYKERQDKALHNKKLAKDTIVEAAKRVIAGLLPAPMELIDRLVKQVKQLGEQYTMEDVSTVASGIKQKITYISTNLQELQHPNKRNICKQIYRNLLFEYHPDRPHGSTELTLYIQRKFELWINRI